MYDPGRGGLTEVPPPSLLPVPASLPNPAPPEPPHPQETLLQMVIAGSRGLRRLVLFMGKEETMNGDKMKISSENSLSKRDRKVETWN